VSEGRLENCSSLPFFIAGPFKDGIVVPGAWQGLQPFPVHDALQ